MNKNIALFTTFFFLSISTIFIAQTEGQVIKGTIVDKQSQQSIPGVIVTIIGTEPLLKAKTDIDGLFHIYNINAGRYDVQATFLGYKDVLIPNVVVTNGKEVVVDISMEENITTINEVTVSSFKKNETINTMSTVSARSFSI
jgi:hypothetical protein